MKRFKNTIVWALILCLGLPVDSISRVLHATEKTAVAVSSQSAAQGQNYFSELFHQYFVLRKTNEPGRIRKLLNMSVKSSEVRIDYDNRPSDLVDAFGINVAEPKELKVSSVEGADGKQKLKIQFENPKSKFSGSYIIIDPPHFDISSITEHDNIIAFHNRDGSIYAIDRTQVQRSFGRGYIGFFRIWNTPPDNGEKVSVIFNMGPFTLDGMSLAPKFMSQASTYKVTDGALMVVKTDEYGNREIQDFLSPADMLRAMTLPQIAMAIAVDNEKLGVKLSLGELQEEFNGWIGEHPEFFEVAKLEANVQKIRSIEADVATSAVASLIKQLEAVNDNKTFTIEKMIVAKDLNLSLSAREILLSIFSKTQKPVRAVQSALIDLVIEVVRQLDGTELKAEERVQLEKIRDLLSAQGALSEKLFQVNQIFSAGPMSFESWVLRDETNLSEVCREIIESAVPTADKNFWEPEDKVLMAALLEFKDALTAYVKENALHPDAKNENFGKILKSLDGLKRVSDSKDIAKLVEHTQLVLSKMPNLSLLDFIAQARAESSPAMSAYAKKANLIHPKNIPFMQKVKESRFMGVLNKITPVIFNYPNLIMASAFGAIYGFQMFSDSYRPEIVKALAYQFAFLFSVKTAFMAWAAYKYPGKGGAYAMGKIGTAIYGKWFSVPPGVVLMKLLGQNNFAFAALNGIMPTFGNGGLTLGRSTFENRQKLVDVVRETEVRRATARDIAFRAVAAQNGISLEATTWSAMQLEWQKKWTAKFEESDKAFEKVREDALLSADPNEIANADTQLVMMKFNRANEFQAFQRELVTEANIVGNQIDEKFEERLNFSAGLSFDQRLALETFAAAKAKEVSEMNSTDQKLMNMVSVARGALLYGSPKILAAPMSVYRASQRAVIRPAVAKMVKSNWETDISLQFVIDGTWTGAPFNGPLKQYFGVQLPTRANESPETAHELFAQRGNFMNIHKDEFVVLRQQDVSYTASAQTRAQTEMPGAGMKVDNPFNAVEVPDAERYEPFMRSASKFFGVAFKPREIGADKYIQQNFVNTFRYLLPSFYIQFVTAGLIGHYPIEKVVAQLIFFKGLGLWAFALPWIPLNLGTNAVNNGLEAKRAEFITARTKFIQAVKNKDEVSARLQLLTLHESFQENDGSLTKDENFGRRSIESITSEELKQIADLLESVPAPTNLEVHPLWQGTTSFVGGVSTTVMAVPFSVFMMSCPLSPVGQALLGCAGLTLYPITAKVFEIYDNAMKKFWDPKQILKDGQAEAKRLSDPKVYGIEVSSRLLARELADQRAVEADKKLTADERAQKLKDIRLRFGLARERFAEKQTELSQGEVISVGSTVSPCASALTKISK